jgi:RimJ/RimL family protein N-acetyltransferase
MVTAKVRAIQEDDARAYLEFLRQLDVETSFLLWEPGERQLDVATARRRIRSQNRSDGIHLIAEEAGQIVGFLVCRRGNPQRIRHGADFAMGVLKRKWGRGIGTRLLEAVEEWALQEGVTRLELGVMAENERAIGLYKKQGYEYEGRKRGAIMINGKPVDEIIMAKLLD